jgi:oligopeptidase A
LREQKFDYTDDQLRPYFPLPRVLDGLFGLSEKLFGIQIERTDGKDAHVWHSDVQFFKVFRDGAHIASFYLDPYSRPADKRGGAWMNSCLERRWVNDTLHLPVVHLCCNGTPPIGDKPSLMSFSEVETLFHEFGHGLQGMLSTVDYADVAGLNGVEWDAVEIASQFMENWCYHKPTLMGMTAHVETGEPLPDDLFEKICAARTFRAGSLMMRQLAFGKIDMLLHHRHDPNGSESAFDVERHVTQEMSVLPPLPEDRFLCAFTHLFSGGYAAGYYSYKWSEVISADAFGAFEEAGLDNEEAVAKMGRKFRDTILAQGGSKPPMDVYREFRGREPSTEALLRHNGLLKA